ncbi:hypothetical protein C0991_009901 [Blastosporella zonata]|nr:hypothetical protein C0991_009901 [Blastosporella zonata]
MDRPVVRPRYGGTCSAGKCQAADFLTTAKAWYTQNLQIAIPVTIVAGLVLLLILWGIAKCRSYSPFLRYFPLTHLPHAGIARCCGYRNPAPSMIKAQHQRLESQDRNSGYPTAPPTFLPPPGTPQFLQPARYYFTSLANRSNIPISTTYSRVPSEQHGGGYNPGGRDNWVDESAYNGRR